MKVKCNSKTCLYNKDGWCSVVLSLLIDATEFDCDSTAPPICLDAEIKEE